MEKNVERTKGMRPSLVQTMTDQKQQENVKCFKYLGRMITNDARCTGEMKSRIAIAEVALNNTKTFFASKLDLHLRNKQVKY